MSGLIHHLSRLLGQTRRLAGWLARKAVPASLTGSQWSGTTFTDAYRRNRAPTPNELMAELKGAAWTCASINASVCASFPPRLYVATAPGQSAPKCAIAPIGKALERRLRTALPYATRTKAALHIHEVLEHPLLDLFARVNPVHSGFDLWELTTLYLEVHGKCFWYLDLDPVLGIPTAVWPLPAQNVTPMREPDSPRLVDYYQYRTGTHEQRFRPDEIIFFRYPDPRDPYLGGLSPLRACFEQVALASDFAAFKKATYENRAIPSAVISPDDVLGEEERDRLEASWNERFRRGGSGRVVVAETKLNVQLLQQSLGDLAALADMNATKEDIANSFHVPLSFLTSQTNLANLQAAEHQHMAKAIGPRLARRDEKLNERLVPLYDPTGRLFLASEDPVPENFDDNLKQLELFLKYGVLSVNEVRSGEGIEPAGWGDVPWLPMQWARTDYEGRADVPSPNVGRNKPPANESGQGE
jgi:HK97 family phage portal protein